MEWIMQNLEALKLILVAVLGLALAVVVVVLLIKAKKLLPAIYFLLDKIAEAEEKYEELLKPEKSQRKLNYVIESMENYLKRNGIKIPLTFIVDVIEWIVSFKNSERNHEE